MYTRLHVHDGGGGAAAPGGGVLTGRDRPGHGGRPRSNYGDTFVTRVGKMSPEFNKNVILSITSVHGVSNAKDFSFFFLGRTTLVPAALWF